MSFRNPVEYRKRINGTTYLMTFEDWGYCWNLKLSSGRKRRELDIYENKNSKSGNSWDVVRWCINTLNNFPYKGRIIVFWADGKRRRVYARFLIPLGFKLTRFDGNLCYYKNFE